MATVAYFSVLVSISPMAGEFDFIQWIQSQQLPAMHVDLGIGDDLAVLNWPPGDLLLVGVDQVLDGVHFDASVHRPRDIGRKAMNRNLSDCAAMACLPAAAMVAFALPRGVGETYAKELYLGIKEAGDAFDCPIVGGDTGSWGGKLTVTVSIFGRSEGIQPIRRSGAKPLDRIYVTGPLGGSILGRHMTFMPKVNLARMFARQFQIHAMIDLTDGVARDLQHICNASGTGAILWTDQIPIHADVGLANAKTDPVTAALTDGEDYELLIVTPDELPEPCIWIGQMREQPGLFLEVESEQAIVDVPLSKLTGWEHQF